MGIKSILISFLNKLPYIKRLYQENQLFHKNSFFPPGHYYSPLVSVDDIYQRQDIIWYKEKIDAIYGIDLNTEYQINLIKEFEKYYNEIPFSDHQNETNRYYFENIWYSYADAIALYSMIRHFQPKQIIEIGSGYSSSVMLDTNEHFFNNSIHLTFIEPNPERLKNLLTLDDAQQIHLIEENVQNISLETFQKLNPGDLLFIDTSHVAKTGSDVNYIIFEILPAIKSGVIIHFHDIFYPFEYPKDWAFAGRNWNEAYVLRAFLTGNQEYKILLFFHYLQLHKKGILRNMPMCNKSTGSNLWMKKK